MLHRVLAAGACSLLALVGCGVEVPDDVARRSNSTTSTTEAPPRTTEAPTSDDELEQVLLDNGYTPDEAGCGAANLRDSLEESQIDEILGAGSIDDIDGPTASDFAAALRDCLEGDGGGGDDGRGG